MTGQRAKDALVKVSIRPMCSTGKRVCFVRCVLAILVVLLSSAGVAVAQGYLSQTGIPTFTTAQRVELGFINLANGNLHLAIPIAALPQRGGRGFAAELVYDSRIWQVVGNTWQPTNIVNSQGGWRFLTSVDAGTVNEALTTQTCQVSTFPPIWDTAYYYSNFTWIAPGGTQKVFPIQTINDSLNACASDTPSGDALALDSSGYHMYVTNYTAATVYAPDGTLVYPNVKDTNGNYFTTDGNGNVVDTLGRTPITKTVNGSQTTYAVSNSQGGSSNFTVTTQTISVNTNFGQSGITEYSGTITVIQSIQLPDGTSYSFSYDSGATRGHFGLLTGITLPTGGQVTYNWITFEDSFGNRNQWVSGRVAGGGTWTFTPQVLTTCPTGTVNCQHQVTINKPSGDSAVYTFTLNNGAWMNQGQFYSGSASPTSLLATIAQTWDTSVPCQPSPCVGASYIRKVTSTTTLPVPGSSSISRTSQFFYDSAQTGNIIKISEWKFYTGSLPATPDRNSFISYLSGTSYAGKNIINRPASVTTCTPTGADSDCNGSGSKIAQIKYTYDSTTLSSAPGVTHHDDTNFGTGNTIRGNPTPIQRWVSGTSYLTTTLYYDTTGQVTQTTDPASNSATYSYDDNNFFNDNGNNPPAAYTPPAPTHAYLTKVTLPLIGAATFGYYFGTGQQAWTKDQNNATAYFHFMDVLSRATSVISPIGGWTLWQYPASSETQVDQYIGITDTTPSAGCVSCRRDRTTLDNLGRVISKLLVSDPDGQTTVSTVYDTNGRVQSVSNPYRSTSDPTYGLERPTYDGMDRVIKITHPDNNAGNVYYGAAVSSGGGTTSQLCSSMTYGLGYPVLSVDEVGNKQQTWTDGLGRIIEADEPDSSGSLSVATCYLYDLNNNLTQLVHGSQTRSYSYDSLSRVTVATAPESGTTNFYYTTSGGALCSGNPTAVCRRTDARGVTTTYSYDALNRLTGATYSDGTTPAVSYFYDQTSYNGLAISNGKGRRTGMSDGSGQTAWSFDNVGNVIQERRTIAGVTKTLSYSYNRDGSLAAITYPSSRIVTYGYSNAQRPVSALDSANSINYATQATYAPPGAPTSILHGQSGTFNGITESYTYNNRVQLGSILASSSNGTALSLSYSFVQSSGNNGSVASQTNNLDNGRNQTYTYDKLDRILTAQSQATAGANCWGQGFSPDPLANLLSVSVTKCSAPMLSVSVSGNNQITNTGFSYDAAGNVTADGSYTYAYDAENRITSAAGVGYTYDGNGLRVKKSNGTLYWRSINGDSLAETDLTGNTILSEYTFFAGQRIARRNGSGNVYFYFADHLGSMRVITDVQGNKCYDTDYYPYGQEAGPFTNTCPQNYKFTGYERDAETGLDYAFARYYNSRLGRFMTADPLGGYLGDPQSLNRYAYVRNSPTKVVDPLGMDPCISEPCDQGGGSGGWSCTLDGIQVPCDLVYAGLQSGAYAGCPNNICQGVNQDSLPVQYIATITGSYYECMLFGTYSTQKAAGIAATNCANGPSIALNTEYSGNLYRMANGKYSFTKPRAGGASSSPFDPSAIPNGTTFAGNYHTHGAFDPGFSNEMFSPQGCNGGEPCDIGLALGYNQGQPMFLGTPEGRILVFYPDQFATFPYGCVLVGSAVPVGPGRSTVPVPVCH